MWGPFDPQNQFGGYNYQMPNTYMPGYQDSMHKSDFQGIITVDGIDGAMSCIVPTNSRVLLMDRHNPRFWIKTVDQYNVANLQEYEFREVKPPAASNADFVSMDQFKALQKELSELKEQYESNIRKSTESTESSESAVTVTSTADDWV